MIRTGLIGLLFFFHLSLTMAQELNFTVIINSDRARTQETGVFEDMKINFEQFLNGRSWTTDQFQAFERIKGNILITISDMPQVGFYNATVQIQTVRPVYGTNYESMVLNFIDRNWSFEFLQSQPLEFNRFSFLNNISSLLAYYAYIALGFDYDSFSLRGGDQFFEIANNIVNNAQQSPRPGWQPNPNDRRNRYWLVNDIYTSSVFAPIREAVYLYHRKGLDLLTTDPDEAYKNITEAIKLVSEVNTLQPNGIFTIAFIDAKGDEISKILKRAPMEVRTEAVGYLMKIDPNNARRYNDILKG
ncbi:MAG: type IX secretion system protein PorD [Cecembia sp.]